MKRFPHEGQFPVLRAFFQERKKIIMGQCGRSHGKTEEILYIVWRFALTNPGSEIYIICPEIKQAKKIYWIPRRLQNYGPQKYVAEHRESELRTVFTNGSHIILDGCENYDSMRGIKPKLVVYDEFQHHTKEFDEEVMQPNLSSGNVSLVTMGTPPKRTCHYVDFRQHHLEAIKSGDTDRYYVELPTEANPMTDKVWLAKKKNELILKKKLNVWKREYEGKLVLDTESAILPFYDKEIHQYSKAYLRSVIERDKRKLNYYAMFDPGTATVFAVLFIAHNPYTNAVYILDEIYAKEKAKMTARAIWTAAVKKMEFWCDNEDKWFCYYDEAAIWFANEVSSGFDVGLIPTAKQRAVKLEEEGRAGESILDTLMMSEGLFHVSEECEFFNWEMENYVKDEQGRYPKTHDHLIDDLMYFVQAAHIDLSLMVDRYDEEREDHLRRTKTPHMLLSDMLTKKDITHNIEPEYYDEGDMDELWMQ